MTALEFRAAPLSDEQWEKLRALTTSLDSKQLLWVSGFMAGMEEAASRGLSRSEAVTSLESAPVEQRTVTILHGSETGNSTALATTLAERAGNLGLKVVLQDMRTYKTRQLKDEQDILIVLSTYGEGDPPDPAIGFFEFVEGRKAPKLPAVRFAVLALGDTTYEHFCEAGKRLDRRFEELGAERLKARVDCDVDYDDLAEDWMSDVLASLASRADAQASGGSASINPSSAVGKALSATYDKRNPFRASVIENLALTGRGSSKETRHIELSIEGSGLTFEPGDALGVIPENDSLIAESLIEAIGANPSDMVDIKGEPFALKDALLSRFEITTLTPRFLEHWATVSGTESLRRLTDENSAEERHQFAHHHHVLDVVRQFPAKGLDPNTLIAGLRPLQPRLYSIASSLGIAPDEVHLTVSAVRYKLHDERRSGVSSGYLADRTTQDTAVPVYIHKNSNFRLPADDTPLIMIGAGTGVAPYRAFMQEREARGASGRSWLFFGERNFRTDFLYQTEWQSYLREGLLSRMDVAFSRDKYQGEHTKVYVQNRLHERAKELYAWLEDGAYVYVCGDASRLAPDVHQTLAAVISAEGGLGPEAANDYLQRLQQECRYQRDVY